MDATALDKLRRRGRFVQLAAALEDPEPASPAIDGPFRDAGGDRVELAARLHELGQVQWHLARFDAAEASLKRALALREQLLGPLDARTLDTRERLAALYHYRVDARAEPLFREVLAQRESVHGAKSVEAAICRRNLGALLRDLGEVEEARALLEPVVKQLVRLVGSEHPEYAAALKAHAFLVAHTAETHVSAERAAVDALVATVRAHDVDHPFAASARILVARTDIRARRYSSAGREINRALAALRAAYGDEHPLIAIALSEDGYIRLHQGDTDDAYDCLRRAAEMQTRWYPRGASAGRMAYDVAIAATASGQLDVAATWIGRAHDAVDDDIDAEHALVGTMLYAARWLANLNDLEAARLVLARARGLDAERNVWRADVDFTIDHLAKRARANRS